MSPSEMPHAPSAALNTSDGARRFIADFFATELRRHDFTDYISTRLAADFACVLAQHLAATGKQQVGEVQGDALRDRTPADYAIEHAGYLVTAANQVLEARNELDALVLRREEDDDVDEDEMQAAQECVGDANSVLRIAIHEFEKRRDRALAARQPRDQDAAVNAMAECLYFAESPATMEDARERAALLLAEALPHLAARQPGAQVPAAQVLSCREGRNTSIINKAFPAGTILCAAPPAQPVGQEPVAEVVKNFAGQVTIVFADGKTVIDHVGAKFYTAPPAQGIDLHRLVPPEWLSELIGGQMDDLTPGQAWRQGFNQCRERTLLLVEQALGFPTDQQRDAAPGVGNG